MTRPHIFLDFDDVICLADPEARLEKPGSFDAMQAMGEIQQGKATVEGHQPLWDVLFHQPAMANLRALHDEFSPVYVLSTSWTRILDLRAMTIILSRGGLDFVVSNLHKDWETQKGRTNRASEIANWLGAHASVTNWVALDDHCSGRGFDESSERVVLCEVGKGFTEVELQKARQILLGDVK